MLQSLEFYHLSNIITVVDSNRLPPQLMHTLSDTLQDTKVKMPIPQVFKILRKIQEDKRLSLKYAMLVYGQLAKNVLSSDDFSSQITVKDKARLLYYYAAIGKKHQIRAADQLIKIFCVDIMDNFQFVDEKTVLNILDAINEAQWSYSDTRAAQQSDMCALNTKLNKFVCEMAIKQPDLVDINFLAQYLAKFSQLKAPAFRSRLEDEMVDMLKDKISDPQTLKSMTDFSATEYIRAADNLKRLDPAFGNIALELFSRDRANAPKTLSTIYGITSRLSEEERPEAENRIIDLIEKHNDTRSQFNNRDYHLAKNFMNASMFEMSDKREALMQRLFDEIKVENLSPRDVNMLLTQYLSQPKRTGLRDDFIEKLCKEKACDKEFINMMSLSDRLTFETSMLCYKTYGNEDYVKDNLREMIRESLDEMEGRINADFVMAQMQQLNRIHKAFEPQQATNSAQAFAVIKNLEKRANLSQFNMKTIDEIESFIINILQWQQKEQRNGKSNERKFREVSLQFLNKIDSEKIFWGNPMAVYNQFRRFQTKFSVTPTYYKEFFKWHTENFKDF